MFTHFLFFNDGLRVLLVTALLMGFPYLVSHAPNSHWALGCPVDETLRAGWFVQLDQAPGDCVVSSSKPNANAKGDRHENDADRVPRHIDRNDS